MRLHDLISRLGVSDTSALGLDTDCVTVEAAPLILNNALPRRVRQHPAAR